MPTAEDCAITHWCPALGGHPEPSGWRADCPVCHAERALEWDVPGRSIRWRSWCPVHDKAAMRPVLIARLPNCLPGRGGGRVPVDHDDLIALMLSPMPPMSMRLAVLEMAGLSTQAALDKLGVRREHRSRVIAGRTGAVPKRVQNGRSLPVPKWVIPPGIRAPKWVQTSRSERH